MLDVAKRRDRLGDNALGVEPCGGVHALGLVVILKFVRQRHGAHLEPVLERAGFAQQGQHMRAEAASRAFLNGDEKLMRRRQSENELSVEGLGEARVGHGGRQAASREFVRRLQGLAEPRAERQDRDPRAFA